MDLMPTLKPVIPLNGVRFTHEFNGKWGSIHSEIYESYRDAIRSRHQMEKVVDFEPSIDPLRLLIGGEYQPAFSRPNLSRFAATKRPRSDSRTRLTPKNKSEYYSHLYETHSHMLCVNLTSLVRGVFKTPELETRSPSEIVRRDHGPESSADDILTASEAGESLKQWEEDLSRE